jgi:DNA-binding response OmpR family regulator
MNGELMILLLDDEPLILMDLEFAAEDSGHRAMCATTCAEALRLIEATRPHVAVLDVSLKGETCEKIARELGHRGIPYLLHSGDLDRQGETVARLGAPLMAKPSPSDSVIAAAVQLVACPA